MTNRMPAPTRLSVSRALRPPAATLSCEPWRSYDGGDHTLYLGKVERGVIGTPGPEYRAALRTAGVGLDVTGWLWTEAMVRRARR